MDQMVIQAPPSTNAPGSSTRTTVRLTPPFAIVHPVAPSLPARRFQRLRALVTRAVLPERVASGWQGYAAAILAVGLATALIALINHFISIANISLVYLLVVLWLAVACGRGPALLASLLAFLAYDFFFIPPFYTLTVSDPTEWLSLFALLITALVLGQLTATVQARAREAHESQQRMATLYSLAQLIASTTEQQGLLEALAQRILELFGSTGIAACTLLLPDTDGRPIARASAAREERALEALGMGVPENEAPATWVLHYGSAVGLPPTTRTRRPQGDFALLYLPLRVGRRIVGVLGMSGTHAIHQLGTGRAASQIQASAHHVSGRPMDHQKELFHACCDQIALALERIILQQQAIHVEALRESNRLQKALLGSVTHDLRTPLAVIQAAANSLLTPGVAWSDAERQELLESITGSAERLNRLVRNLLDLSRLEAGVATPESTWYLIGDSIATILDQLARAGMLAGRPIQVEIPDSIPLTFFDPRQIEQVLMNLVENALKYSPPDSIIQIKARVAESTSELEVRVSDQGIGVPPQEAQAIFTKFYRVQHVRLPWASNRPPLGTGLGLAICASIVQAHRGRIWVESSAGRGATFVFTLPLPQDSPQRTLPELPWLQEQAASS
jgi:two-component system, OmpR family, sensor histidine kinase KdpD